MSNSAYTIIGLAGYPGAGKKVVASRLEHVHGFWRLAFADPLYEGLATLLNLAAADIATGRKDEVLPQVGKSVRQVLDEYGEWVRAKLGSNALIVRLEERMHATAKYGHTDAFVITDVHRDDEVAWIRAQGGAIWWVARTAHHEDDLRTAALQALHQRCNRPEDAYVFNDSQDAHLAVQVDRRIEERLAVEFAAP